MTAFLRRAFNELLIPTSVAGIWLFAHIRSTSGWPMTGRWMDARGGYHTGNPFTAPVAGIPVGLDDDDEDDDKGKPVDVVAGATAADDSRP
jgi:hypothetical protein